jgi:RNA polymerase sigma-70 factor (ECF subfamily)
VVQVDEGAVNDSDTDAYRAEFVNFADDAGERLRRVLVAGYGVDIGNDVCADALAYAWENWERVRGFDNPIGYLYRVAQSSHRRHLRWRRRPPFPIEQARDSEPLDPELGSALGRLSRRQRSCVVLVHVYDWTYQQTADALNLPVSSVRNDVHRGLIALRKALEL